MSKATIWHNPKCSTSRKVLDALRAKGIEPVIVEYLKTPPSKAEIVRVCKLAGIAPADLLRRKGDAWAASGLDAQSSADQILEAMVREPVLIERPVVVTDKAARLCRPPERWTEIL